MGKYDITDISVPEPMPTDKQWALVLKLCSELCISRPKLATISEASRWIDKHLDQLREERRMDEDDWPDDWGDR
jgi:hypothetical protein